MANWEELTNEELCLLYQQTNDDSLFEYFLERNRRLGAEFSLKYRQIFPQYYSEFEQGVRVAMWRCMKKYNPSFGGQFSTLFYYYVRSECQAVIRSQHMIKLPRYVWWQLKKLEEENSNRIYDTVSLDSDYNNGDSEEITLSSSIADEGLTPEEVVIQAQTTEKLNRIIDRYLLPSEATAIKKYFGLAGYEPHTLQQIGDECNVSKVRVKQLISKGLNRLKARRKILDALRKDYVDEGH